MATRSAESRDRSAGISYQQLIAADVVPPPPVLQLESPYQSSLLSVSVDRYRTRDWHDLEMQIYEAERKLREVQATRSERIEELGNRLRRLNIATVPGVVMVFAVILGAWRSVRRRHYISHASDA